MAQFSHTIAGQVRLDIEAEHLRLFRRVRVRPEAKLPARLTSILRAELSVMERCRFPAAD